MADICHLKKRRLWQAVNNLWASDMLNVWSVKIVVDLVVLKFPVIHCFVAISKSGDCAGAGILGRYIFKAKKNYD